MSQSSSARDRARYSIASSRLPVVPGDEILEALDGAVVVVLLEVGPAELVHRLVEELAVRVRQRLLVGDRCLVELPIVEVHLADSQPDLGRVGALGELVHERLPRLAGPLIVVVGAKEAFLIAAAVAAAAVLGALLFRSVRQLSSVPAEMQTLS